MSTKIHFRDYNPKQMILFPQRLDKDIAENDPVRVIDMVTQVQLASAKLRNMFVKFFFGCRKSKFFSWS